MTVHQLKELLKDAPNDAVVYIGSLDDVLQGFRFQEACVNECGMTDFGESSDDDVTGGFVIMPHGMSDQCGHNEEPPAQLN
jgi:hypothetical protein